MLLKDFKIYFIASFIAILCLDLLLMFPAMAYEEGMTQAKGAEIAYYFVSITLFSLSFWAKYLNFFDIVDIIMAVATTALIISSLITMISYCFSKAHK